MHEKSIAEIDFEELTRDRQFHPSPENWEDQALYFLLVDRFSDGRETNYKDNGGKLVRGEGTPRFRPSRDVNGAVKTPEDAKKWREAGDTFVGGNLKGLTSKLGYLKRMGITAVWVSPIFKQRRSDKYSYHGYAIQNFLEVDPRFGTRDDLKTFVAEAHAMGIYVILDVIVNHCADVFAYGDAHGGEIAPTYTGEEFPVLGFRDKNGKPTLPFGPVDTRKHPDAWPEAAVWPCELQIPEAFTRKGTMQHWDAFPEFEQGDFFNFKDLNLGSHDGQGKFCPSAALEALIQVYRFWIAYADLDGFRLDTVKHMGQGATRHFASAIEDFARALGKDNFTLIGEISGGRKSAHSTLDATGLDAALGIDEIPARMRSVITGSGNPADYFRLFRNHPKEGHSDDPAWWRGRIVTFFDDHDQVGRSVKSRFAAEFGKDRHRAEKAVIAALGLNLMTLGIPCIYYGTEQGFNGHAQGTDGGDRYVREAMLGGEFGSFCSRGAHFFNENSRAYRELTKLLALRAEHPALRRGRQYLRELSENGEDFALPIAGETGEWRGIIAWSRLLDVDEFVCALNTDPDHAHSTWVTVDADCHASGSRPLKCRYSTDPDQIETETSSPPEPRNGSAICLTVPPGGFVVYQ
ncbi:MAG: alpha-amylase [Cytophagales bacterium]|nr:alpha-amylase [Armatimonadota bacterium]